MNRIDQLLASLTLEEKAALTAGSDAWHTVGLPDHGVGRVKVTDGPTGARGDGASGATATCFPVGVALGATWDVELLAEIGAALAEEAKTKGAHVLLGPTVNLQRTPIGGRNFECYSEDPMLTARLAVAFVRGLQANGIGACIKHFVGNDVEFDRHEISADMDDATLREVALLPFELAVREADTWSIMSAYNRLNGETCTANHELLTSILKDEWAWPGAVISDWGAVKSTAETALAGNDLEMPGPAKWLGPRLADAVKNGEVPESQLDDLARRVLRLAERAGRLDDTDEPREQSVDDPGRRALARRAARSSMVLLRNEGGLLPLDRSSVRKVALVGPNVAGFMVQGGGSSQVRPHSAIVGPLDALRAALGEDVEVVHAPGCHNEKYAPSIANERWEGASDDGGGERSMASLVFARRREGAPIKVELFDGGELDGAPVWAYEADGMSTVWWGSSIRGLSGDSFSGRMTGRLVPARSGSHEFGLSAVGRSRLTIGRTVVVDNWTDPKPGDTFFARGSEERRGRIDLTAGEVVEVVLEFATPDRDDICGVRVGVVEPDETDLLADAVAAARDADVVIAIVGTTGEWESEGNDRRDLALPGGQAELVEAVAAVNPRTVVVLNAGSPVETDWIEGVASVLQVWFAGQEMGPALVDVLLGDAEPGGRLPHTVPVRLEDHPAAASYPGSGGRLPYDEGVRCGHRWYDSEGIEPRFPFGHGLSYATFEWGDATVDGEAPACTVSVRVTNTSDRPGSEVVQVYVTPPSGSDRPERELKGFAKVELDPGASADVDVPLDETAFRRWRDGGWTIDPGVYRLTVGASSRDLRSSVDVSIPG